MAANYTLKPMDGRKSFGGKATVTINNGILTLLSYATEVASINKDDRTFIVNGFYSATTARHINAFLMNESATDKHLTESEIKSLAGVPQRF